MPPTPPLSYMLNGGIAAPSWMSRSYPPIALQSTFDFGDAGTYSSYLGPQQQMLQDLLRLEHPLQQQHSQHQTEYGLPTGHQHAVAQQPVGYNHSHGPSLQPQQIHQHPLPQPTQWQQQQQQAAYTRPHASPHQLQSMYQHFQPQLGQWQQEQPTEYTNPSSRVSQPLPEYEHQPLREFALPQVSTSSQGITSPQGLTLPQQLIPPQMHWQMTSRRNQVATENPALGPAPQATIMSIRALLSEISARPISGSTRKRKFISMNMAAQKPKKPRTKKESTGTTSKRADKGDKEPGKFRCPGSDPECLKQTFRTMTDLNRHLKHSAKHISPMFRCYYPECRQSRSNHYVRSDSLLRHLRLDHPDDPYLPEISRQLAAEAAAQFRAQTEMKS